MSHQKAADLNRLFAETRPVILMINHNWGGGVEKHVKELVSFFTNLATFLVLRPEINEHVSVSWENDGESLSLCFRIPGEYDILKSFLKRVGVCKLHFHHVVNVPHIIQRLPEELSIPYDVTLHDYYMICPNIFLVDKNDRYCGEKGEFACRKCAADQNLDIHTWRKDHHSFLKGADRIIAPSRDTASRFQAYFDGLNIIEAYHLDHESAGSYPEPAFFEISSAENLRVVIMGDLSRRKGADILIDVSALAEQENVLLEFHLMGHAYRRLSEKINSRLTVYGLYTEETRNSLLKKINPHIGWIPALWPETYSYVLSEMMAFGLPIAATRIGAFPERLNNRSLSWILDWNIRPSEWIEFFLSIRKQFVTEGNLQTIIDHSQKSGSCFSYRTDYLPTASSPVINAIEDKSFLQIYLDLPSNVFNEADYLSSNPDVAEQVVLRNLSSGWEHWLKYGKKENRKISIISMMSQMNPLLVSIIVRTKDRPQLLIRALQSIAGQTYRPIEVVLVNDGGCDLEIKKIKDILGSVSLNYIRLEQSSGRAHAGNIGIKNAKGRYVGFLDDDDIYYKDAISVLCSAMNCGGWPVVYGQEVLKFYNEKGRLDISKKDTLTALPFDRDILLYQNIIPFNALLFDERLFHDIGSLDESLTVCEDWDFVLNIADKYYITYIPQVVVEHSSFGEYLGCGRFTEDEKQKSEEIVRLKRLNKTTISIVTKQIDFTVTRYEAEKIALQSLVAAFEAETARQKDELKKSDIETERVRSCLLECKKEVQILQSSISWRITVPFRTFRSILRKSVAVFKFFMLKGNANLKKAVRYIQTYGAYAFVKKLHLYLYRRTAFSPNGSGYDCLRPNIIPHQVYCDWLQRNGATEGDLISQRNEVLSWPNAPLISLIIPVYNTYPKWLDSALKSIFKQSYCNWEALIVDDCSTNNGTDSVIKSWLNIDARFKDVRRQVNGGVAAASQDGLLAAKGEFVTVIDHDDLLEPDALFCVAKKIVEDRNVDVIYTDEVLMDGNENVFKIVFRPDFSLNFLLSHPYIVHLTVYRKEMGIAAGGYNLNYEVSQDYEFLLKIASKSNKFVHIPRALYRWRIHPTSTGNQKQGKVMDLSRKAIGDYLNNIGEKGSYVVDGPSFNFFRVRRKIKPSLIDIIIPTKDRVDLLQACVNSLYKKTVLPADVHFRIIIADNGSVQENTISYFNSLKEKETIIVDCCGPFNYSSINNKAASAGNGDIILFLNNDIEIIESEWLVAMLEQAQQPEVGAVGAKLLYPDGTIQHAGVLIGINGIAGHSHQFFPEYTDDHLAGGHIDSLLSIRECMAVTAACLMVRRSVFEEIGGFDENFVVGFGDTDLCLRMYVKGYKIIWTPYARLIHHESASRGKSSLETHMADTTLMRLKWDEIIKKGDPYYNPNLSLRSNNFSPK